MPHRLRRGAARIPVIWMVVVGVAFFAALGLLIATSSDVTALNEQLVVAREEKAAAEQRFLDELEFSRGLSELAGYYDRSAASARTDVESMRQGLDQFKQSFPPTMGSDVTNFEDALGRARQAHRTLAVSLTERDQEIARLQTESQQKQAAMDQLASSKDTQINDLRTQLADAQAAANARQNDLEGQVSSVRSTLGDTETELVSVRNEMDDERRAARDKRLEMEARAKELGRKLEVFLREPESADGRILAVSEDLNLGWIDLGKRQRLFAGMAFTIVSGTPGVDKVKGRAQVLSVRDDMAEVMLMDQVDPFDPPTQGDALYNPLYDPRGGRNAVLLGRFSGTYNEGELKALLTEININVQSKLDKTTDFLIVGSEVYTDEDGEPLEEAMPPSEMPVYKEAEAMGVQIVPVKIVRDFFHRTSM